LVGFSSALAIFAAAATPAAATEPFTKKFLRFDFAMFSSEREQYGRTEMPPVFFDSTNFPSHSPGRAA
jgi:hypothetical protein